MRSLMKAVGLWGVLFTLSSHIAVAQPAGQGQDPLQVVASIRPLALLVEDVAGNAADVSTLVPGTASPHSYNLRVSDMRSLRAADLVVWLGPDFERFLQKPLKQRPDNSVLALGSLAGSDEADDVEGNAGHHGHDSHHPHRHDDDAHLWLNPKLAVVMLEAIAERLIELRPADAERFSQNLARVKQEITRASQDVATLLAPVADRPFGVNHDAYRHFADYFGLQQVASVSTMPDQALSAGHMRDIIKQLQDARCLIVEPTESPAAVARLEQLFGLATVPADHLALDGGIRSYPDLLRKLGEQFRTCLE